MGELAFCERCARLFGIIAAMCFSLASLAVCAVLTNCADIALSTASSGERQVEFVAKIKARYLSNHVSSSEDKFYLYAIADNSGGSYMVTPTNNAFTVGDVMSIAGTSRFFGTIDNFAVFPKDLHLLQHEDPEPPTPASVRQIADGKMHFRIVSVTGVVIEAFHDELDPRWNWIIIHDHGVTIPLAVPGKSATQEVLCGFVGSDVSAVGLCAPPTGNRRFPDFIVRLESFDDVRIVRRESGEAFSAPLLDAFARVAPFQRFCLDGQVLATCGDGHVFVLPESGSAVEVRIRRLAKLPKVGDFVRVSGFVAPEIFIRRLIQSIWRPLEGRPNAPGAVDVEPRQILFDESGKLRIVPEFHGRLIRLTGVVAGDANDISGCRLLPLDCGGYMVSADISALPDSFGDDMRTGTRISAAGVCRMEFDDESSVTGVPRLRGFSLVVRSNGDISILARPAWWTPMRLIAVIGALFIVLVVILVWNMSLRILAERRGRELLRENVAHIAADLRTTERTRLAVDLHDSLAQMLTGVSLQIDAGNLDMAAKSLASCRDELRNCIWDLRNRTLEEADLGEALRRTLKPHVGTATLAIRFNVPRSKLSDTTAHSVIMIVRELVTNAIRHGKASDIHVAGGLDSDELKFSVRDNGCGFDPNSHPGLAEGHFGLQGVHERVMRCGGTLAIESVIGKGTKVTVSLKRRK